ncbi:hypothetical protein [Litoreibacter halocynthiae]|uniref:hypothetical protein n=1 Tax=Litoreibacter halocynthiae TaxID=1242689 RepID=UPI002493007D|nr:hypothetical protein [Litoreibacter halocynthiae]
MTTKKKRQPIIIKPGHQKPEHMRPYPFDKTESDDFVQPTARVTSLMNNLFNMQVTNQPIGSETWMKSALRMLRRYVYTELEEIIGTIENPIVPFFIAKRSRPELKKWTKARSTDGSEQDDHPFPHPSSRVRKAVDWLSRMPLGQSAFITVITSVQLTYWDALIAAKKDGQRLVNLLNRRLKGEKHSFIIVPEVDLVTVGDIADGLMGTADWKSGLGTNRVVYKVHFHGVLFVDGMVVDDIQHILTHSNRNRRTKVFFGLNRIRSVPLYKHPQHEDRNDAGGCVGYSLKQHYRPTNRYRHLETMPEWFILNFAMEADASLIRTSGIGSVKNHEKT